MTTILGRAARRARRVLRSTVLDLRCGAYLGGRGPWRYAASGALWTQSTPYEALEAIFSAIPIGPEEVLVDVGCGQGRVIHYWLLSGLRNRMIGLEIDPEVAAATAQRFRRRPNVEIRAGDALTALPRDGTIWYLGNPFSREVAVRFVEALVDCRGERGATIGFFNLHHADLFPQPPWTIEDVPSPPGIYGRLAVMRLAPGSAPRSAPA
jgi:hypothetical protein